MTTRRVLRMAAKLLVAWALLMVAVVVVRCLAAHVAGGVYAVSEVVDMPPAEVAGVGLCVIVLALAALWKSKLDDRRR